MSYSTDPNIPPTTTGIILAGGQGTRFGSADKVMAHLAGRPMLSWVLDAFEQARLVDDVVLVIGRHIQGDVEKAVAHSRWSKLETVASGGELRQDSMQIGLGFVKPSVSFVAVHDGARPLVTPHDIDRCIMAASGAHAAILASPVTDTIKSVNRGFVESTIPRERLMAAQTPQVAFRSVLLEAMTKAEKHGRVFTDEAGLLEWFGHAVTVVPVTSPNPKVTLPSDLISAEALLRAREVKTP